MQSKKPHIVVDPTLNPLLNLRTHFIFFLPPSTPRYSSHTGSFGFTIKIVHLLFICCRMNPEIHVTKPLISLLKSFFLLHAFIVFFHYYLVPLHPTPLQPLHCCPCPWVLFPFCSIPLPTARPALAVIQFSFYESVSILLVIMSVRIFRSLYSTLQPVPPSPWYSWLHVYWLMFFSLHTYKY